MGLASFRPPDETIFKMAQDIVSRRRQRSDAAVSAPALALSALPAEASKGITERALSALEAGLKSRRWERFRPGSIVRNSAEAAAIDGARGSLPPARVRFRSRRPARF
jgi:hypothetical protein